MDTIADIFATKVALLYYPPWCTSTSQMNEKHLRGLKRPELQLLAREHNIKANLKSSVIIDLLLQRLKTGSRSTESPPPARRQEGAACNIQEPQNNPGEAGDANATSLLWMDELLTFPENEGRRSESEPQPEESSRSSAKIVWDHETRFFYKPLDLDQIARDVGLSYPGSPPDIKNFDREQLPAPENLVRETVAMLAELERGDQQLMDTVVKMHETISELKARTKDTRALLRAENARRRRAEQYFLYWRPISKAWSYEEVWSGSIKIRHDDDLAGVTTSDEEDGEEDMEGDDVVAMNKDTGCQEDTHERAITQYTSDQGTEGEKLAYALLSPVQVPLVAAENYNAIVGQKRMREADAHTPSDDGRYAARRRIEHDPETRERCEEGALEPLYRSHLHLGPTPKSVNKGKEKMTADQVAELENERAAERLLVETAEACHSPDMRGNVAFTGKEACGGGSSGSSLRLPAHQSSETKAATPLTVQDEIVNPVHETNQSVTIEPVQTLTNTRVEAQVQLPRPTFVLNPINPLAMERPRGDHQNQYSETTQAERQVQPPRPMFVLNSNNPLAMAVVTSPAFSSASQQPPTTRPMTRKRRRDE